MKKIVTIKEIENKNYENIILCHGTFDYFHIGHLNYLKEAKKLGGTLVVSITADIFVNKGPKRPMFSHDQRADLIEAIEIVDHVIINHNPTAIEIIQALKPRFYVKGPDYKNNNEDPTGMIKFEVEATEKYGGTVVYTDTKKLSSTDIINELFNE